ncbi:MAG: hypothetical protein HOP30_15165 [Cyclobacteriaceae bacterium]|nr:hypothetical protein [Cyclobacteriaceae bacterium]
MNKAVAILIIILQIVWTLILTSGIFIYFGDFAFLGRRGLFANTFEIAIALSILTIFTCLMVGLPIRIFKRANHWWYTHYSVAIIIIICGVTFLYLSSLAIFSENIKYDIDGEAGIERLPNTQLSIPGWLLITFGLVHFYPPSHIIDQMTLILKKTFKG